MWWCARGAGDLTLQLSQTRPEAPAFLFVLVNAFSFFLFFLFSIYHDEEDDEDGEDDDDFFFF